MKIITRVLVKLPKRNKYSKKGDNGRVLSICGSKEYVGAAALSGIAALRSGCDSVVIAAPNKVAWAINCLNPDLITCKLKGEFLSLDNFKEIKPFLKTADCLLIGGGIKERPESAKLIKKIVTSFKNFKVLDAAALFVFDIRSLQNAILTPNPKEYSRLQEYCDIYQILKKGNIIIAKSARTKIYYQNQIFENRTGNAGLTKAGTGDVLAGLIAGFLAQSKNLLQSAVNGVYFLGLLGDALYKKKQGYFYLASDLAQEVKRIGKV